MAALITNATMLDYHDWRWIAENMLDTDPGTAATLADLLNTATTAGARLQRLISAASDMLLAAACGQNRYTVADIVTYGGDLRDWIVANLAIGPVLSRRDRAMEDLDALSLAYKQAMDYIEQLRNGERIFYAVPNVPEAGLQENASMDPIPGINPPLISQVACRYFGGGRPTAQDW